MGLLERAVASNAKSDSVSKNARTGGASGGIENRIADFYRENPLFHCMMLQAGDGNGQKLMQDVSDMTASHDAACVDLPGGKCLVLLPGALDRELFAHRLSRSTGSTVLFQSTASSSALAIEMLKPYMGI